MYSRPDYSVLPADTWDPTSEDFRSRDPTRTRRAGAAHQRTSARRINFSPREHAAVLRESVDLHVYYLLQLDKTEESKSGIRARFLSPYYIIYPSMYAYIYIFSHTSSVCIHIRIKVSRYTHFSPQPTGPRRTALTAYIILHVCVYIHTYIYLYVIY